MSLCSRCRERNASRGKYSTPSWESRCKYCKLATAGAADRLREEFPEEAPTNA